MGQCNGRSVNHIETLLTRYGFEIKQVTIPELIETWLASYSMYWVRLAIVEALYQGRYKAVSVEHILELWRRLGHPIYHFTYEFERLINRHLFVEDAVKHNEDHHKETAEKSVSIDKVVGVTGKNTVTLTPIQELVKKIVIPVSISGNRLSTKPDINELSHDFIIESLKIKEDKIEQPEIETFIPLVKQTAVMAIEKPPRSIDQFVPACDSSDFYSKLKAVAYQKLEEGGEN